jgi:hypothetical protein
MEAVSILTGTVCSVGRPDTGMYVRRKGTGTSVLCTFPKLRPAAFYNSRRPGKTRLPPLQLPQWDADYRWGFCCVGMSSTWFNGRIEADAIGCINKKYSIQTQTVYSYSEFWNFFSFKLKISNAGVVNRLTAWRLGVWGSIRGRDSRYYSIPWRRELLWGMWTSYVTQTGDW